MANKTTRAGPWLFAGVILAMLCIGIPVHAQADVILPALGGPGGGKFLAHCGPDELLTGLDLRTGDDVDAIRPICVSAVGGRVSEFPNMFGGSGGGPRQLFCPPYTPVVTGMYVGWEGTHTVIVNNIHLFCGINAGSQTASDYPAAVFDGPEIPSHAGPLIKHQHCRGLQRMLLGGWLDVIEDDGDTQLSGLSAQ